MVASHGPHAHPFQIKTKSHHITTHPSTPVLPLLLLLSPTSVLGERERGLTVRRVHTQYENYAPILPILPIKPSCTHSAGVQASRHLPVRSLFPYVYTDPSQARYLGSRLTASIFCSLGAAWHVTFGVCSTCTS